MTNLEIVLPIVLTTLLILLLIAGITISFFIASRQRAKQQIELAQARLNYERELRQVEVEVSEQLMHQFAQELHDNIGQILTCIRLELENKKIDHPGLEQILKPMGLYLDDASQQLRLLSRSLNTDYVTHIGLSNAIQVEIERQQQLKKFQVHWEQANGRPSLDRNQELMVFRIFQEIINNAMKHSKARNLYVKLNTEPTFELSVRDDGKGFPLDETLQSSQASGLKNIIRRATMAGLSCHINATPGAGCIYTLQKIEPSPRIDSGIIFS